MIKKIFLAAVLAFALPLASAYASVYVTISSPSPSTTVSPGTTVSFTISASGATSPIYGISDSFSGSSVSDNNISGSGNFNWTPNSNDVGTHILAISVADGLGNSSAIQQQIVVSNSATVSINSINPGNAINIGEVATFNLTAPGFTNPTYSFKDSFSGSSLTSSNLSSDGSFRWVPAVGDMGNHVITVTANDTYGHTATNQVSFNVSSNVPLASIDSLSPGSNVTVGQALNFLVNAYGFTDRAYTVKDSFTGSTVNQSSINSGGYFHWVPQSSDVGLHSIAVNVSDALGHNASVNTAVAVTSGTITTTGTLASLSSAQIQTVTALLQTLGASQTLINKVTVVLAGGGSVGSTVAVATPATSGASGYVFNTYLYEGLTSAQVTNLQTVLKQHGYFSGAATGYFGPLTKAAVIKFQAAKGLTQIGVVGPATRAALNKL